MSGSSDTIRVVIPLSIRKRNGRPKILPPEGHCAREGRAQDPHRSEEHTSELQSH